MSHSYDELRALSDDELIKAHDELAKSTLVASLTIWRSWPEGTLEKSMRLC